jgi:hypothetical protein
VRVSPQAVAPEATSFVLLAREPLPDELLTAVQVARTHAYTATHLLGLCWPALAVDWRAAGVIHAIPANGVALSACACPVRQRACADRVLLVWCDSRELLRAQVLLMTREEFEALREEHGAGQVGPKRICSKGLLASTCPGVPPAGPHGSSPSKDPPYADAQGGAGAGPSSSAAGKAGGKVRTHMRI